MGVTGDLGKPVDDDPVERLPSRVGAVASYCPPTDFLNFRQFTRDTMAASLGLGVTAWSPLAGGILTGKQLEPGGAKGSRQSDVAMAGNHNWMNREFLLLINYIVARTKHR